LRSIISRPTEIHYAAYCQISERWQSKRSRFAQQFVCDQTKRGSDQEYDAKASVVWLVWVITEGMPFSAVEDDDD
jgi:hypothetical protein